MLPIPGGLHKRLSCSSIRPHSSEGKLAEKLDTGSLWVSRLLWGGQARVKFRPVFSNVEEWPLIAPHPCVVCCCRGTWHWRCYWSAAGGADNCLIGTDPVYEPLIKDSGRCVTDLGAKGRLGPPRDDRLLACFKNWLGGLVGRGNPDHVLFHSFSISHWFSSSLSTLTLRK